MRKGGKHGRPNRCRQLVTSQYHYTNYKSTSKLWLFALNIFIYFAQSFGVNILMDRRSDIYTYKFQTHTEHPESDWLPVYFHAN